MPLRYPARAELPDRAIRIAVAVLLALTVRSSTAWAQQAHPIELLWHAPPSCPDGAAVLAEVDRLLGAVPSGDKRMVVDAQARGAAQRWTLEMVIRDNDGEGERSIEGKSCQELADAAALIIALAFDAEAVVETKRREAEARSPSPMTAPPPSSTAAPPPSPVAARPLSPTALGWPEIPSSYVPRPPPPSGKRVWVSIAPSLNFDVGTLPGVTLAVGGSAALRWYPIVARLRGSYFFPRTATLDPRSVGGDFDMWALAPGICATPFHTAAYGRRRTFDVALDGCVEVELGKMRGEGFGVRNPGSGSTVWVTPHAQVWGALTLADPLSTRAMIGVGVPVRRPDFVLQQVGVVHVASPVVGRAGLEIALIF